jgi:hypothetical protein
VVRGAIANDLLEKTYFTGTDKPRVTTNDIAALGAGRHEPAARVLHPRHPGAERGTGQR